MELVNVLLAVGTISSVTAWIGYEFAKYKAFLSEESRKEVYFATEALEKTKDGCRVVSIPHKQWPAWADNVNPMHDGKGAVVINNNVAYSHESDFVKNALEAVLANSTEPRTLAKTQRATDYWDEVIKENKLANECDKLVESSHDFGEKTDVFKNVEWATTDEPPVTKKDAVVNSRNSVGISKHAPIFENDFRQGNGGW